MKKQLSKVMAATLVVSSVPAVALADTTGEKLVGKNRFETAIKISKSCKTADTVVLVNEKAIADALAITPLAEEKNAPILLTGKDSLNKLTKEEIQRLGAKNVILAGGNSVLSEKLEKELKDLKLNIDRIAGKNREETSLEILKRLDNINDISEFVVVNGTTGLADAVSVASIAAKNNMGIILANPKNGVKVFEEFIKNEDIKKSYVIGGDTALPNKLIENLPSKERISGANRTETNIKILEKFYSSKKLNAIYVAKDGMSKEDQLVDALAIGVVAAKNNSPVIIVSEGLKNYQKDYVNSKKIGKVVQVGGNGNEKAYEEILNIQKSKTYEVDSLKEFNEALNKADANDKIVINFDTDEDIVIDTESSVDIENNGNLGQVTLDNSNADITNNGTIDTLEIKDSDNTEIKNEGKIDKVEIGSGSSNVEIDNSGNIGNVENNGKDTKIDNKGTIDKVTGDKMPSIEGNKPGGSTGGGSGSGDTEVVEESYPVNEEMFKNVIKDSKDKVSSIIFTNKIPTDINSNTSDLSENGDKTVISYTTDNTLYIAANGKVLAPENMSNMFANFDGTEIDLSSLDTSNVKDMSSMFYKSYNLEKIEFSESFNTSSVSNMSNMFNICINLKKLEFPESFNTSSVTDMNNMFYECHNLEKIEFPESFNTSSVTDMNNMFYNCHSLTNLDVNDFNTSNVQNMSYMFSDCSNLTQLDVSNFNTLNVQNMSYMFNNCSNLTQLDVSNFNTLNVQNMNYMFNKCNNLTQLDVSNFNTSNAQNMNDMFSDCTSLKKIEFSKSFDTSSVTTMNSMFDGCSNLEKLEFPESFDTSSVTDMKNMFKDCTSLEKLEFPESFDTSSVTDMSNMFEDCTGFKKLDISNFNTSNVQNMSFMFNNCNNLTGSITIMNPNIINYTFMFADTSILGTFYLDYINDATKDKAEEIVSNAMNSNVQLGKLKQLPTT